MLRGRRLLLPQASLSGWRTSASTTTVLARYFSARHPLPLNRLDADHSALAKEVDDQPKEQKPATKESIGRGQQDQQAGPSAKSETDTENPGRATHAREIDTNALKPGAVFRKYKLPDPNPNTKLPRRKDAPSRKQSTSGTPRDNLSTDRAWYGSGPEEFARWSEWWVKRIGKRIGTRLSKRDAVYFKATIARRLGIDPSDTRLATPAGAFAAVDEHERVAKAAAKEGLQDQTAFFRPLRPAAEGAPTGAAQAPQIPTSKLGMARARQAVLRAEGKPALAFRREMKPQYVQPEAGDLISTSLRGRLKDSEGGGRTNLHAKAAESSTTASMPAEAAPWNRPFGFAGSTWPAFKGERAPTVVRFTMQPAWVRSNRPVDRWGQNVTEQKPATVDVEGLPNKSPKLKTDSEDQQQLQNLKDTTAEPTGPLNPLACPSSPTPQDIFGMLFRPAEESATSSEPDSSKQKAKPARKHRWMLEKPRGNIFNRLFPDESPEGTEAQSEETPAATTVVPPEDAIFISLRNEIRNWIPEHQRNEITAPEPGEYGSHSTVVMLSGLSNSLIDTDFYRILPEGKHIEGWAGGLVKVVQARDRLTHEPVGRYFLMFHSRPAADAYKAEVLRLHDLSKRLLHSTTGTGPLSDAPTDPQPFLTKEEQDAVRAFTLCPPTAPLRVNSHMWNTNLVREIARNTTIADVVQALRPDISTPAKVLVTVNTIPGSKAGAGGGLTPDELWLTLRDDGRERGAPWVLANLKEGIMPVKMTSTSVHGKIDVRSEAMHAALEGPIYDEADMVAEQPAATTAEPLVARRVTHTKVYDAKARNEGTLGMQALAPEAKSTPTRVVERDAKFNRFVVTFAQSAVARRFVRSWHKRAIWDAYEQRNVTIDAVALM